MVKRIIRVSDDVVLRDIFQKFVIPQKYSYKGQNGKVLIIGGSSLFHAASLWAAETASFFVDMVHYCSTEENEKIFLNLKTKFRNGMIVRKNDLLEYVKEDDVVLIGPGMIRGKISNKQIKNQKDLINIKDEALYTYFLTQFLIKNFSEKKFVIDAGSLQMMDKDWLLKLKTKAIITPHQKEFEKLFSEKIVNLNFQEKIDVVEKNAKKYNIVILLKSVNDIISDGDETVVVEGGNQGLTKGGTGDVLSALTASFYVKNEPIDSAVFASIVLKKTADELFNQYGYWYNVSNIIDHLPKTLKHLKKL